MNANNYVEKSLELHLFSGRIMKEHSLFLKAGFTPVNGSFADKAEFFKEEFEKLLCAALKLTNGFISQKVLCSGELVTDFTSTAEKQTECLTGITINKEITERELCLKSGGIKCADSMDMRNQVHRLNRRALELLDGLICFKETILKNVLCGDMFTANYPLLLEHIIREAKLYRKSVEAIERNGCATEQSMKETECFWNQIMMEHATFIRGLLDPCETELFDTADDFAEEYCELLNKCRNSGERTLTASLETTERFRSFKTAGVEGIEQHKIRSVILPLLADHVLREANHYIRLLKN